MGAGSTQFLAFKFGSDSKFEGQLVGALERIESGGVMRVVDGLFVAREPGSGELSAISLAGRPTSTMTSRLLGFRLDAGERNAATRRALSGPEGDAVRALAASLIPGTAIAAVLIHHSWADALTDAVARVGGTEVASDFVEASRMTELLPRLLSAAEQVGASHDSRPEVSEP
jgi:hypothetical protein